MSIQPHHNDVLFGRGGKINNHPGNKAFRKLISQFKEVRLLAKDNKEKRFIIDEVIAVIENLSPPGRFLNKNSSTGLWYDVGYEKAKEKVSQGLREDAKLLNVDEVRHIESNTLIEQSTNLTEQIHGPNHGHSLTHPNVINDFSTDNIPEATENGLFSIPTNMEPSLESSGVMSNTNGEEIDEDLMELYDCSFPMQESHGTIGGLDDNSIMNIEIPDISLQLDTYVCENSMRTPASSFNSGEHMISIDEQINFMERIPRHESHNIIGGQSLVHVFDGNSTRKRGICDIAMLASMPDRRPSDVSFFFADI